MSKIRAIILLFSAILLGLLMIQPFNYFCRLTDKCHPIFLSYYLPKKTSKEKYEIFFMMKDRMKEIQFTVDERSKIVAAGDDVTVIYHAKNISDHEVVISPKPYFEPEEVGKYIKFYECLCLRKHKIGAGKSINLLVRINLKRDIVEDKNFADNRIIVVGYEVD